MTLLFALLLAASPAASPDRAMLDAFKSACARTGDMAAMKADALAAGWQEIAEDADPRVARLVRKGREEAGGDAGVSGAAFRRTEAGRDLFLVQSRAESAEGYWGIGCRVYDFAAAAPLDPAQLQAWMGKPPTGVETPAPGLGRRLWEPGWRPGITVEASYVAPGHPLGQSLGLQGNILVAQAIGGF
jgi:hypothetical protein